MEDGSGRFNKWLSNLVNFVMGSMEYPTFSVEYSDGEYDDDECCEDEDQCEDE
jgi:hypothetical protein